MQFKDPNFKIACLDILFDQGFFTEELDEILSLHPENEFDEYDINPKRFKALLDLDVTQKHLDQITDFAPDGGDDIYFHVIPYWSGEEEALYIQNLSDIKLLRNLESLYLYAVIKPKSLDLINLLELENLNKVHLSRFYFKDENFDIVLKELIKKEIEIKID